MSVSASHLMLVYPICVFYGSYRIVILSCVGTGKCFSARKPLISFFLPLCLCGNSSSVCGEFLLPNIFSDSQKTMKVRVGDFRTCVLLLVMCLTLHLMVWNSIRQCYVYSCRTPTFSWSSQFFAIMYVLLTSFEITSS